MSADSTDPNVSYFRGQKINMSPEKLLAVLQIIKKSFSQAGEQISHEKEEKQLAEILRELEK